MLKLTRLHYPGIVMVVFFIFSANIFAETETVQTAAASSEALPFDHACRKILAYYPRLKSQAAKVEEAVASKYEAYAALLPRVEGVSSVTQGNDPVYVFGSLLRQEKFSSDSFALSHLNSPRPRTNFNFALRGEMPLFNAFQTISMIRSSRLLLKAEIAQESFLKMEASLLGTEGYLKGLLMQENLKWVREVRAAAESDLQQADELKTKGMVLGADFYAAKMILSEMKQMDYQVSADERTSHILLNILMGEPAELSYRLSGQIPEKVREKKPLQEWIRSAYGSRPDLSAFEEKVSARQIDTEREKMSALPKIGAFGEVAEDTHDFQTASGSFLMGIKGSVNVLDAGYWARRKKAKAAYDAVLQDYQALKDRITKDVSQAANGFEAVTANIPMAEEGFNDAAEAAKQTEVLYREGRKSIADLLEIRRAFLYAAFKRNELFFQAEMAYANLLFLSGKLDEAAVGEIAQRIEGAL